MNSINVNCNVRVLGLGTLAALSIVTTSVLAQVQELKSLSVVGGRFNAVQVTGEHAVVAEGRQVVVLDISDEANPAPIGRAILPARVAEIVVSGRYAYVAVPSTGMHIIDLSDPSALREVGDYPAFAAGLTVEGNLVYITTDSGLEIIDVSSPVAPELVGQVVTGVPSWRVQVSGDYAYVTTSNFNLLQIIDVQDPTSPFLANSFSTTLRPIGIVISSGNAFVAEEAPVEPGSRLAIYDISDPLVPVLRASHPFIQAQDVAVLNGLAYVTGLGQGLGILDVSDPDNPLILSNYFTPWGAFDVVVRGNRAYLTDWDGGFIVLDVSNPLTPALVGNYTEPGDVTGVALSGNHAYVTGGLITFRVFDVADVLNPVEVGRLTHSAIGCAPGCDNVRNMDVSQGLVYVSEFMNGVRVVDVTSPSTPVEVTLFDTPGEVFDVSVDGNYLYVADGTQGLTILDIATPSAPSILSTTALPNNAEARGVVVRESYAYVASTIHGLVVVDVSNPSAPTGLINANLSKDGLHVSLEEDFAYVAAGIQGFVKVDISDPANPVEFGSFEALMPGEDFSQVIAQEDTAFVTGKSIGLRAIDSSVAGAFSVIARELIDTGSGDIELGNFAYVSSLASGIDIFPVPPPPPILSPVPTPFIDADTLTITGTAAAGSFVTVGGGVLPLFQQLADGQTGFSIEVSLRQEAVNTLSVTTMNEFGLVSLPAIARVVEGVVYPSTVETVTALAVTPDPATDVPLDGTLAFTCTATFSDASMADVSQFVQWEDIANGEVVTPGGLYVNTKGGTAQVRAFVAGVFSNVVSIGDGP